MNMENQKVSISEKWAWVVVRKSTGSIVSEAGIEFEREAKVCPEQVKINPIYKDEYENVRVNVMVSRNITI